MRLPDADRDRLALLAERRGHAATKMALLQAQADAVQADARRADAEAAAVLARHGLRGLDVRVVLEDGADAGLVRDASTGAEYDPPAADVPAPAAANGAPS